MMKKLMNKKKNNKGFSLVELIVVVLIIAIIAVALAPQVMKWVGTSKVNVDENNASIIKSAVTTAVADYVGRGNTATDVTFEINGSNPGATMGAYQTYIEEVMNGDWPATKDGTGGFTVVIASGGAVTVTH